MAWSWKDTRHPIEKAADARYAAERERRMPDAETVTVKTDEVGVADPVVKAVTSTDAINGAADRLVTARVLTQVARGPMPIRGIGDAVAAVRKSISSCRTEIAGLGVDSAALMTTVKLARDHINQTHSDLKFEIETLGNGGNGADQSGDEHEG